MTVLLVVLAIGFAYSMGAHYTGACMGMPHALHAISARNALLLMAPLTLLGATFASHGLEHTVGHGLLTGAGLSVAGIARGRQSVHAPTLFGILRGWVIGPGAGIVLAYAITRAAVALAGGHYFTA